MKNHTIKLIPTRKYHSSPRLTHEFKRRLKRGMKWLVVNREFIDFIEGTLKKLPQKDKLSCLHYFKKLANQVHRAPDAAHFEAHKDEYLEEMSKIADEQKFYNPVKWIIEEIEYCKVTQEMSSSSETPYQQNEHKSPEKLFDADLVPEKTMITMLNMSKSKFLRFRAEGMPYQKIGKPIYYDLEKVKEWFKTRVE